MERRDLVIVGGGPAGSTLAWALRDSGLAVTVLDRRPFPRDKTCAGWVTPAVLSALALDTHEYRAGGRVLQPIHGFQIGVLGAAAVRNHHGTSPVSFGIRRFEFDHYLLQRCGAELRTGEALRSLERDGRDWIVNGTLRAPLVIGAGGHFCPVARRLESSAARHAPIVAAQEVEFEMSAGQQAACPVPGEMPQLYFCPDLKGYGWVFRKGGYLNVGLGREDSDALGARVEQFHALLVAAGIVPADLPQRFNGHAYLLYNRAPRPLVSDGIVLLGDAAGLAYPQSGEGIRPAVESALLAARVLRAAGADLRHAPLGEYARLVQQRFGPRAVGPRGIARAPSPFKRILAGRLLRSPWFTRRVVTERWFLHLEQPPLSA